jgi:fatty-acyl-CoA synthase
VLPEPVQVFVGGSPPSPSLLERASALRLRVTHLYGMTETYGPLAVCAWQPAWDYKPAAEQLRLQARQGVGTVVTEPLRVVDANMRDVPADAESVGELVMRGNNVMTGYYRDSAGTEQAFRGGWFHSGDLAVMHPDGYIELRDRLKDIVISGGENISTIEVEQAFAAHPAVAEVAVIGVPDERWGEVPKAFVTLRHGCFVDSAELRTFLRERLAGFKVPKDIEVVTELPKTATGKIQKFVLRAAALAPSATARP